MAVSRIRMTFICHTASVRRCHLVGRHTMTPTGVLIAFQFFSFASCRGCRGTRRRRDTASCGVESRGVISVVLLRRGVRLVDPPSTLQGEGAVVVGAMNDDADRRR